MQTGRRLGIVILILLAAWAAPVSAQNLTPSQKQALAGQERNLDQIEAALGALTSSAQIQDFRNKLDSVLNQLQRNRIPDAEPRAVALKGRVDKAREALAAAEPKVKEAEAAKAKLSDVSSYPNFDADVKWLLSADQSYSWSRFADDPEQTASLLKAFGDVQKEFLAKREAYQPLVNSPSKHGEFIKQKFNGAERAFKGFHAKINDYLKKALTETPAAIDQALELAKQGQAERKPAFFTGGVKQQQDLAWRNLRVLLAINEKAEKSVALKAKYDEAQAAIEQMAATLKEEIVAATPAPADQYGGADKEDLRAEIEAAWKKQWPDDEILAVRMTDPDWNRRQKWEKVGNALEWSDWSYLGSRVVVKHSDTIARIYGAVVNLDNSTGTRSIGANTKGKDWVVEEMLLANFK